MPPPLSAEEHRLLSEWLSESYGICYGPEKRDILRARLDPCRSDLGMETFEQLYFHLKFHPRRKAELERLIPKLTNNESYFFRERRQFDLLSEEVFDELMPRLRRAGRQEVRFLSAGCSRGQEPYSLAIALRESARFGAPWRRRITGVDIDRAALDAARAGRFTAHSFRGVEARIRDRYFRATADAWAIRSEVQKMVEFAPANLVEPGWAKAFPPQDVIFCRNVLIYFDDDGIRRALEGLYDALAPGGYLFLGHSESLSRHPHQFEVERRPGAVFYRRGNE